MRIALLIALLAGSFAGWTHAHERVELVFAGGHETEQRDHGRPDILIAAALGVPTDVFREAFSHVTPARGGAEPEAEQVRKNKHALMSALAPYGVTNERLDQVSNYYRYNRERGQRVWRSTPATAYATVQGGKITSFTIVQAGSGYSSAPQVSVPGLADLKVDVRLAFGTELRSNGSVSELAKLD